MKEEWKSNQIIRECSRYVGGCLECIDNLVITLGKHGVLIVRKNPQELFPLRASSHSMSSDSMGPSVTHYKAVREDLLPVSVKSVSGAGDRLVAYPESFIPFFLITLRKEIFVIKRLK